MVADLVPFQHTPLLSALCLKAFLRYRRVSHLRSEPAPHRYQYPACMKLPIILYPGCMIQVRGPSLSPERSEYASTSVIGLSRRFISLFFYAPMHPGSYICLFFINVQAITSIFAASLTLILVLIPFSRSLFLSLFVNQVMKERSLVEAIRAAW